MNRLIKFSLFSSLTLLALPSAATAAGGALTGPERLAPEVRDSLSIAIAEARARDPRVFDDVARLRADLPELDRQRRGRLVPVTLILKPMGERALLPLLERIAFADPERGELSASAWRAWQAGLVEAVGNLRDERAAPVLRVIMDGPALDPLVMRETVGAFAKLDTPAVAEELVARSLRDGPWYEALLAGMGYCRRLSVAERLSQVLDAQPAAPVARLVARALGNLGGGGSWELLGERGWPDETEIRTLAARSLVRLHRRYDDPEVTRLATKALLVVDHDATPAFIADARQGAEAAQLDRLDELARRFARSPLRRRR